MPKHPIGVDHSCFTLAEHFLRNEETENNENEKDFIRSLAKTIQLAVEDWFLEHDL